MFLTVNKEVVGVARRQTMPHIRYCYIMSSGVNEPYLHLRHEVDEGLRVISSKAGNQAMV